jgi:two-component system, chemotaxis family, sensor kinase CheA
MTPTGHEDEFRQLFAREAQGRLSSLADAAMELERRGADPELVSQMFRDAHTLKGGAAVVGFSEVSEVVHELEQLLDQLRKGRLEVGAGVPDAVLGSVDGLRAMIDAAMTGRPVTDAAGVVRAALAKAGTAPPEPSPPSPPPTPEHDPEAMVVAAPAPAVAVPAPVRADPREAIPVPVDRLDRLVRLVGEAAAAQLRVGRMLSDRLEDDPADVDEYREMAQALGELQQQTMRARMVSVGTIAGPLRRAVRDIAHDRGKQVRWELAGESTELDRHVLEHLREPLVALVRNAADHGIEAPAERADAGKPQEGRVRLHARQLGAEVVISVADDGRGIDTARVQEATGGSEGDALEAIFRPGVSTAETVTEVSGRGVGLDAVRSAVGALRGRVEVRTTAGAGTEFRISVPMTLATLRCLLVRAGGRPYALPMHSTATALPPSAEGGRDMNVEGRRTVWLGDETIGLTDLTRVLGMPAADGPPGPAVVLTALGARHAFRVDELLGQRDVVLKDLGRLLPRLDLLAGASVEPDGSIMLVLDAAGLVAAARGTAPLPIAAPSEALAPPAAEPAGGRVLVVDDALTIRELQRSILERAGYEVTTAATGREAMARLVEDGADLVLTDVEMPGMDGLELTAVIRDTPALASTPVLILTTRGGEEDRQRGLEAGADVYLVKSAFDERALLAAVRGLLESG